MISCDSYRVGFAKQNQARHSVLLLLSVAVAIPRRSRVCLECTHSWHNKITENTCNFAYMTISTVYGNLKVENCMLYNVVTVKIIRMLFLYRYMI
jgi:hypothetical protein